ADPGRSRPRNFRRRVLRRAPRPPAHRRRLRPLRRRRAGGGPPDRGDSRRRLAATRGHSPGRPRRTSLVRVRVMTEIPAIRLAGVSKHYGGNAALLPTDLEIAEGEFFCLLGPSGCGKTTTLNLIGGFVNVSSGEIYIRERRVDRLPPHQRSVNTVFQSYALFPHMSVRANV